MTEENGDMVLVSAIITTCKREPAIVKRALLSIIGQTYENIEIIVVDDSPADYEQRDAVEQMIYDVGQESGREIKLIRHKSCMGANVARNTGLANCHGKYVGYLDDDDEWLPRKVEVMIRCFDDKTGIVYSAREVSRSGGKQIKKVYPEKHNGMVYDILILKNYIGSTSFPLIRKEALETAGGFDEQMQAAQDFDMWLRISGLYEVRYVDEILNRYYIHEGEQITKNPQKRVNGLERLNQKNKDYLDTHRKAYWIRYMKMIPIYRDNKERHKAFATWGRCVIKCPLNVKGNFKYLWHIFR